MLKAPGAVQNQERNPKSSLDQKFWPAMGLFALLAAVVWFTLGEGTVLVSGKPVAIRMIPLLVIGLFVFRTVMAREADNIRRRKLAEKVSPDRDTGEL